MKNFIKVAACQMRVTKNPEKNIERLVYWLKVAAKKKVDIVCFPEACIREFPYQVKFNDNAAKIVSEKCKKLKIHCIFGTYIKDKNKIFNCAFVIDDKGEIIYRYEKIHLWIGDKTQGASPGKQDIPIETKFGKIGVIICYDINFPDLVIKLARQGANIIFCPTFEVLTREEKKHMTPAAIIIEHYEAVERAVDSESFVVLADAYTRPKNTYALSQICSPDRIMRQIKGREGLITADLKLSTIKKLREKGDFLK